MRDQYVKEFREWKYQHVIPANLTILENHLEKQFIIKNPVSGSVKAEFSCFDSFLVSQISVHLDESTPCIFDGQGETMGLYFNLSGNCSSINSGSEISIGSGQQSIYYSSSLHEQLTLLPENGLVQCVEINFPVAYYTHLLSGYSIVQDQFINRILSQKNNFIPLGTLPMTLPMKWIINTIRQCTRTGVLKRLFLEAKILELLMLQVEQVEQRGHQRNESTSKSSELDALYEAKIILEGSLDKPPTIKQLAKRIGLNEFNLKKGFKDTFNTTIYGYVNNLKMQQAKQMLLEGNKSINEISTLAGYKNPQHFTAAFKKYFGMLPSKLK